MKIRLMASVSLEFQKFEYETEVECEEQEIKAFQREINRIAVQGLADLVEKKRELAGRLKK